MRNCLCAIQGHEHIVFVYSIITLMLMKNDIFNLDMGFTRSEEVKNTCIIS